ncbi:uncharacterized protein LOC141912808 [Tubulanus polymorphus]|uniref:uncharacterized protein LOC141912808 n=1 Tax=Tubulanus polymorphus TaxID=672921 RepID=UPI003DA43D19
MEFFNDQNDVSLQEMIECDIKTEIEELLKNGNLSTEDADHVEIGNEEYSKLSSYWNSAMATDIDSALEMDSSSTDLRDFLMQVENNVIMQSAANCTDDLGENKNPNLLVNPQTVMPVLQQQQQHQQQTRFHHVSGLVSSQPSPSSVATSVKISTTTPTKPQLQFTTLTPNNIHIRQNFVQHHQIRKQPQHQQQQQAPKLEEKIFPKPVYSYSCLIAMALKNSQRGHLPVSEIYNFMTHNFPYFKTAPDGWKNSVRHNLSLNKCFEKIENPTISAGNTRKGCLWGLNPAKIPKMDDEIAKWRKKDPVAIHRSMAKPDDLDMIEQGLKGTPSEPKYGELTKSNNNNDDDVLLGELNMLNNDILGQHGLFGSQNVMWNEDGDLNIDNVTTSLPSQSPITLSRQVGLSDSSTSLLFAAQSPYLSVDNYNQSNIFLSPSSRILSAQT